MKHSTTRHSNAFNPPALAILCKSETVKMVHVAAPDDVYRYASVHAALHGTSVDALVAEYLRVLFSHDAEFQRLLNMQNEVIREVQGFTVSDNLSRKELHDR